MTSAVESVDDGVLARLEKGHTRADFERAVALCRETGLALAPTFVAFTPWTTPACYLDLLREIDRLDLVDSVAPIQLAIRLLIPQGSRMLELPDVRAVTSAFDPASLTYPWAHPDPAVDALHAAVAAIVGRLAERRSAGGLRPHLGGGAPPRWCRARDPAPCVAAAAGRDPLPERALVLLSGADRRAVGSDLTSDAAVPRVLILSTTTGYQLRSFGERRHAPAST